MRTDGPTQLEVTGLTLDLAGRRILESVNLTLGAGEFLGLIGPNGGGKTTLLRVMLGLLRPNLGRVHWCPDASGTVPRLGYVPQRTSVDQNFPLCAREIIRQGAGGCWPRWGRRAAEVNTQAEYWLERLDLQAQARTPFVHLSGGQQRRLLLGRALMSRPSVLLLDEPTAGVDVRGQEEFCAILRELSHQGLSVVLVSHDIPMISEYADRIACLAVSLHWHGPAEALDAHTVRHAYRCELDRYQTRPARSCGTVGPVETPRSDGPGDEAKPRPADLCLARHPE